MLLAPAFAGCLLGDDGSPADDTGIRPSFDSSTGAITGRVTTEDIVPIVGAQVGRLQANGKVLEETTTDAQGRFAFHLVPPGTYKVQAVAPGYAADTKDVTVTSGTTTADVLFRLVQVSSNAPYHRTYTYNLLLSGVMWKLTPSCIYTDVDPLVKTCGGVRLAGCDECETHSNTMKDFNANWITILGELAWKPQSGFTGRGFLLDINAPNITRGQGGSINQADPKTWHTESGRSPIAIRIDKPTSLEERKIPETDWNNPPDAACTTGGNCDWFFRVFPAACDLNICPQGFGPDYGIMYEGRATMYFSFFIREPAPKEFTALPPS